MLSGTASGGVGGAGGAGAGVGATLLRGSVAILCALVEKKAKVEVWVGRLLKARVFRERCVGVRTRLERGVVRARCAEG